MNLITIDFLFRTVPLPQECNVILKQFLAHHLQLPQRSRLK